MDRKASMLSTPAASGWCKEQRIYISFFFLCVFAIYKNCLYLQSTIKRTSTTLQICIYFITELLTSKAHHEGDNQSTNDHAFHETKSSDGRGRLGSLLGQGCFLILLPGEEDA